MNNAIIILLIIIQSIIMIWLYFKSRAYTTSVKMSIQDYDHTIDLLLQKVFPPKFKTYDTVQSLAAFCKYTNTIEGKVIEINSEIKIGSKREYMVLVEKEYLGTNLEPPFDFVDIAPYTMIFREDRLILAPTVETPPAPSDSAHKSPDQSPE